MLRRRFIHTRTHRKHPLFKAVAKCFLSYEETEKTIVYTKHGYTGRILKNNLKILVFLFDFTGSKNAPDKYTCTLVVPQQNNLQATVYTMRSVEEVDSTLKALRKINKMVPNY